MNPILLALLRAGKIAGPLAGKIIPKIKKAVTAIDKVVTKPRYVNEYIHPYGTVGAASAANAYLYGGLAHDAATGSFGPIEKKKLASIWNELDYNRGRLEGDELVRHISRTNDYPK